MTDRVILAYSGGLIGPDGTPRDSRGNLNGTPVFLGCSDHDPHIPLKRVEESADLLSKLGGNVDKRIYPSLGHDINTDEISAVQQLMQEVAARSVE